MQGYLRTKDLENIKIVRLYRKLEKIEKIKGLLITIYLTTTRLQIIRGVH